MKHAVLFGSALPPDLVAAHRMASAAAARWQIEFASAVASQLNVTVDCISFLPLAIGEQPYRATKEIQLEGVRVTPVVWHRRVGGTLAYCLKMLGQVAGRRKTDLVFCYNPGFWTAPWAILLTLFSGAPLIIIVADVASAAGGAVSRIVGRLERALLRGGSRFLLLSPATKELLRGSVRVEVFPGLADATASALPLPRYSERVRFVFAGALNEYAGIETFLDASAEIAAEYPSAEFHVFGRGTLSHAVPEAVSERIVFHGFVSQEELDAFLGDSCVGVNPRPAAPALSRYNAPFKLIHYVSRGLATITTITPGVTTEIAEACIVASDGSSGLAVAMRKVMCMSPTEREKLGRNARAAANLHLSAETLAIRIRRLLSAPAT